MRSLERERMKHRTENMDEVGRRGRERKRNRGL